VIASNDVNFKKESSESVEEVFFEKPVAIGAGKLYTVTAKLRGPSCNAGQDGKARVESNGVIFKFRY
jgi:hypothetical protein